MLLILFTVADVDPKKISGIAEKNVKSDKSKYLQNIGKQSKAKCIFSRSLLLKGQTVNIAIKMTWSGSN